MGRIINGDAFTSTGQGLLGNNMFAYCRNSPVFRIDISGTYDVECDDVNPVYDEIVHEDSGLGGGSNPNNNSSGSTPNGSNATIYGFGYVKEGAEKLVPTENDVKMEHKYGLSFSLKPRSGSGMTTTDAITSTGVLHVVFDEGNHVSVYPIGATLSEWRAAGVNSVWTQALLGVMQPYFPKEIVNK